MASVTSARPAKSMATKWSMRTPVSCSTVWMSSVGPPNAYDALILFIPYPGMSTQVSRGIEMIWACCRSASARAIMIASDRAPGASPSAATSRESEPTSRNVVGSPSTPSAVGLAGAGRASSGMSANTSPSRSTLPA
jgi:hypothetical protein